MTIGDILAVIAAILAVAATWAAAILALGLLFSAKVEAVRELLTVAPGRVFLRGLLTTVAVALVAMVVNSSHSGPTRILAGALWCGLLILSAIGSAGIARLLAERIEAAGSNAAGFPVLVRATALYVAAGFLPVVGWFVITPLALLFSVGAASAALLPGRRRTRPAETAPSPAMPVGAEAAP